MKTYQDFTKISENELDRMEFVKSAINEHRSSNMFRTALIAGEYDKQRNVTITNYQKLLYTITGQAVPDNYSANWKMSSGFFHRFVVQEVQYLFGNGITWENESTKTRLGEDFDIMLQKAGKSALIGGVAFGFFNLDHLDVFGITEFVPLYDEENGSMRAGIRFWQIADDKPLRATLYEEDGYTEYIWRKEEASVLIDKRAYITKIRSSEIDGTEIYDFENYPSFPIIPLWGNTRHQSEIVGIREQIDCYDLIKSGFANDIDDASMIYWTIQNAGGMDDIDLAKFVERMKTVKAAAVEDSGARAEAHTMEVPSGSREVLLERIKKDLYQDAMVLNTDDIANGAVNTTQIKAAYEPLNMKTDDFEYCVHEFLDGILRVAGIEGESPTFTRSIISNADENINTLVAAAQFLDGEYVTRKILTVLGDGDKADEMLRKMDADELDRMTSIERPQAASSEEIEEIRSDEQGAATE